MFVVLVDFFFLMRMAKAVFYMRMLMNTILFSPVNAFLRQIADYNQKPSDYDRN